MYWGYRIPVQVFLFKYFISFFINLSYTICHIYVIYYLLTLLWAYNLSIQSIYLGHSNIPPVPPPPHPQVLTIDELIPSLTQSLVCLDSAYIKINELHIILIYLCYQCCFTVTDGDIYIQLHTETLPGLARKEKRKHVNLPLCMQWSQ